MSATASALTNPAAPADWGVTCQRLTITAHRTRLLGPITLQLPAQSLILITSSSPAARYAFACAVTGRLPTERLRLSGELAVAGRTAAPMIRAITALPQSWHVRDGDSDLHRRQSALQWAQRRKVALVALSPGLDALTDPEVLTLMSAAQDLRDLGITVVITTPRLQVETAQRLADVTIDLDKTVTLTPTH